MLQFRSYFPRNNNETIVTFTISALPDPVIVNMHFFALFITGRVRVIRDGGGLGESLIGQTHKLASFKSL